MTWCLSSSMRSERGSWSPACTGRAGMREPYRVQVLSHGRYELRLLVGFFGKTTQAAAEYMIPWRGEWTPEICSAYFDGGSQMDVYVALFDNPSAKRKPEHCRDTRRNRNTGVLTAVFRFEVMDLDAKCISTNPDESFPPSKIVAATPITDFYSGKSVFVTGGTGFLGTVLIGKLLTTCKIKRVYMLMKAKNHMSVEKRLAEFVKSPVFDEIRKCNISILNNIIPISGNLREKKLGMCEDDIATLCAEVHVVFHVAADIRLSPSGLKEMLDVNTTATAEVVALSKRMQRLQVFLYVSTAYSNCQRRLIDEKVYEPCASIEAIYDISENTQSGKVLDNQIKHLMENRSTTYAFSKSLAEKIVQECCVVPSAIVRPSVVTSSISFPEPGWTNSWSAHNSIILAVADGLLHCMPGDDECLHDLVPVDLVANLIIASAWDVRKNRTEAVKVFNCCSGLQNPITFGNSVRCGVRLARKHSWTAIFTRFFMAVKNHKMFVILWFLLQSIPAYILDTLSLSKHRIGKTNARLLRVLTASEYFFFTDFTFIDFNTRRLLRDMDPRDQTLFDFNFGNIDWEPYLESYVCGLRKYLKWK